MSSLPLWIIPILYLLVLALLYSYFSKYISHFFARFLLKFSIISREYESKIPTAFWRTVRLNWYVIVMLVGLWVILFTVQIGEDMIEVFLDKDSTGDFGAGFWPLLFIFTVTLVMSLSIWLIPFYMYSQNRKDEILGRLDKENEQSVSGPTRDNRRTIEFYIATKLLVFFAMIPFMLVANAFFFYSQVIEKSVPLVLVGNIGFLLAFIVLIRLLELPSAERFFNWVYQLPFLTHRNPYLTKLVRIFFWVLLMAILLGFVGKYGEFPAWSIGVYLFFASVAVFRILFYSNEDGDERDIRAVEAVNLMLSEQNSKDSKLLYRVVFWTLVILVAYYYFIPSLEPTNTLYILMVVLSFYIILLDYLRNRYRNSVGFKKILALLSTLFIIALPFLKFDKQFRIELQTSDVFLEQSNYLEEAVRTRYESIVKGSNGDSTVFIVCAQGGGSRAGYITARVLQKIDVLYDGLWKRTIAYSTVSGGTVGLYSYIRGREFQISKQDTPFFASIFRKNYNSSGVFGLLAGDAIESAFGYLAAYPKSLIKGNKTSYGFNDRNQRIRNEYDFVMSAAQTRDKSFHQRGYLGHSFYPFKHELDARLNQGFKAYYQLHKENIPIHLINTFEINNGVRTILSPYSVRNGPLVFPNAILPLQDTAFDDLIREMDIAYRDATNLSELFPLISAASHIGEKSNAQFVDGGYYENYGVAAALDVFRFLRDSIGIPRKFIRLLMIKNSPQKLEEEKKNIQLFAPLIGAMNAPFKGHANHLLEEAKLQLGSANVFTIEFDSDADSLKVPLTRSLTSTHIERMEIYLKKLDSIPGLIDFLKKKPG